MSVIGSEILAGASGNQGYFLDRSLRFRSSASAYLNRTPDSAGNRRTMTFSAWVKRGTLPSSRQVIFGAHPSDIAFMGFESDSTFFYDVQPAFGTRYRWRTTAVFRDPSSWYHIVFAVDTTNATAANRFKFYVNGVDTPFNIDIGGTGYVPQNTQLDFNSAEVHAIGSYASSINLLFDGYMTEINFIDGQALTPSSFGDNNASTGVWQPKKYAGTYGTNGFYLPFSNNASTTTLGNDFSGNGNNWTANNISLTAGSTYDSMTDVPTQAQISGNGNSNYCVVNPLNNTAGYLTVSGGNLNVSIGAYDKVAFGTMALPTTGKYYFEYLVTSAGAATAIGLGDNTTAQSSGSGFSGGNFKVVGSYSNNDLVGVAIDMDAGTGTIYKNNSSYNTLTGLTGTTWYPCSYINNASGSFNFGQRPFAYTPPTGFVALNTYNLPTPTIGATASTQANKYFDATIWTGTGNTARTFTGLGFQPDLVWAKKRSGATNHQLYDSVRGAGNNKELESNTTGAEGSSNADIYGYLSSFNSDGFTASLGTDGSFPADYFNGSGSTYVAWQWKGGNGTVTNTAGTITSTVSANTSAGFSIVTYTGTGSAATVGHGLGVTPKLVIIKNRSDTASWQVWSFLTTQASGSCLTSTTFDIGTNKTGGSLLLNTTFAASTYYIDNQVNANGNNYVAYCFAEVAGYSKFASYTGNGNSDGPFVFTGFRPKFVIIKRSSTSGDSWILIDSTRSPSNITSVALAADSSSAEFSYSVLDFVSNGFKVRGTSSNTAVNASGDTYIYMAFAENPFKYSLAR
jgi:hypothetical protein